ANGVASGFLRFLENDVVAKVDAFSADEHRRPGDKLAYLVLVLAAEGAMQGLIVPRTFFIGHRNFGSVRATPIVRRENGGRSAHSGSTVRKKCLPVGRIQRGLAEVSPVRCGTPEPCPPAHKIAHLRPT